MTLRLKTKYKVCKLYRADIWAKIFIRRKTLKFRKALAPRPRRYVTLGTFRGDLRKASKYYRKRKSRFGKNLSAKQRILRFYAGIKERQFKKYLLNNQKFKNELLIRVLTNVEQRLDVILYRSNLVKSIFDARSYIIHRKTLVNNEIVNKPSKTVEFEDIISTESPLRFWRRLKRTRFVWGYCPEHLHVNWKTMKIGLHSTPNIKRIIYPFKIRQRRVLEFYKV